MPHVPHLLAGWPASPPGKRPARRIASLLLAAGLAAGAPTAFAVAPASAASICDPGTDYCVVSDTVQTPLGPATVTVSAGNVVTVQLTPTSPGSLVYGMPFAIPPGPPALPGYTRTSITTIGGVVDIDTFQTLPGSPNRFDMSSLAIVSIHPPSPCRVSTSGTTVVFTPIIPPGPPG
ncbi:MAG TPA: hypothetical protein VMU94_27115 [Streptosporangiaceae bacterium]|nr:hypothetical protein [Streptosporangiaceae bacterium]